MITKIELRVGDGFLRKQMLINFSLKRPLRKVDKDMKSLAHCSIDLVELGNGQLQLLSVSDVRLQCIPFQVNTFECFVLRQL